MMKKAFTLIELMIVVAIIAIIAAIAIPNLLAAKMSANETSAIGSLNAIKNAQTLFSQRDIDGDGASNYWNFNVYGLYAIANNADEAIKLIQDPATALSDRDGATALFAGAAVSYATAFPTPVAADIKPKQGYYIEAMPNLAGTVAAGATSAAPGTLTDGAALVAQDWIEGTSFSFFAAPDKYNSSGVTTYIINEQGTVYQGDLGEGYDTATFAVNSWPSENPNVALLKNSTGDIAGRAWQVAK